MTGGRPLRILQVVHVYAPAVCGSELLFRKIAEGLVTRGIEVTVFTSTSRSPDDLNARSTASVSAGTEVISGVTVRRFPRRQFAPPMLRGFSGLTHLWSTWQAPGYGILKAAKIGPFLPGLVPAAMQLMPDVIAATPAPCLPIFRAASAARRIHRPFAVMPCLHSDHDWFMDNPALLRVLRNAEGVMALTEYEMRILRALDVPAARLWLIGGGIATDAADGAQRGLRARFGVADREPIVLFCGRKEQSKGPGDLLEAMARLWRHGQTATLVLAGSATDYSRSELSQRIAALPAEWGRHIVVRDDIGETEKWGWYSECDVFAHPSRDESFGLVYLEAWLCGKPVIGGRTGPQQCVIDEGVDGLLVRPGDVDELTDALRRLLSEGDTGRTLGRAGKAKVLAQFTWASVVSRAEDMYRSLADRHSRAAH